MPVAPLFVADMDTLKLELRLQGLRDGSEGESILSRTTSAARVSIYRELGTSLVATLAAQSDVDNPTTSTEVRRKAATLLEVELIRCRLLEVMPVIVGDVSGDKDEIYNDEGVWRKVSPDERQDLIDNCQLYIQQLLGMILEPDDLGDATTINSFDGNHSTQEKCYPAGTAFPGIHPFPGNFNFFVEGSIDG